jgi:hypothetical protein
LSNPRCQPPIKVLFGHHTHSQRFSPTMIRLHLGPMAAQHHSFKVPRNFKWEMFTYIWAISRLMVRQFTETTTEFPLNHATMQAGTCCWNTPPPMPSTIPAPDSMPQSVMKTHASR